MAQIQMVPGPFSFLTTLGQAGGAAFASAEEQRRRRSDEAFNVAELIMKGVEGGYLPRSVLSSKEVSSVFGHLFTGKEGAAGVSPGYVPTPAEPIARGQTKYFEDVEAGRVPQEEGRLALSTGAVPTVSGAGKEKIQADTLKGGGAAARQAAGVLSGPVATSLESQAVSAGIEPEAARIVDEALGAGTVTDANFDQIVDKAVQTYTSTLGQQAALTPDAARRYFASALREKMLEQYDLTSRRIAASQRSLSQDPRYMQILQEQIPVLTGMLNAIPKPSETDRRVAAAYTAKRAQMKTPEEREAFDATPGAAIMLEAYTRVQSYDQLQQSLVDIMSGTQGAVTQRLSEGRLRGQEPGTEFGQLQSDIDVEGIAEFVVQGKATMQQVQNRLRRGQITQETYDQIVNLVVEKQRTNLDTLIGGKPRPRQNPRDVIKPEAPVRDVTGGRR